MKFYTKGTLESERKKISRTKKNKNRQKVDERYSFNGEWRLCLFFSLKTLGGQMSYRQEHSLLYDS